MKEIEFPSAELWQRMPPIPAEVVRKYCGIAIDRINRRPYGIDTLQQYAPMLQLIANLMHESKGPRELMQMIDTAHGDAQDLLDEAEAKRR